MSSSTHNSDNNNMNNASALCSQGRKAWQEQEYSLALQHFGNAVRLLESSLGTFHPLVAKTYYWIGFIYKHSLPSPSSTRSSSSSTTPASSSLKQVEIAYLLLALQAFTKSTRIRLSLPEKKHDNTATTAAAHDKAIQEAKQAIQWVLRALQERYKQSGGIVDEEESSDAGNTSTWQHQKAFKRLILQSRTSSSRTPQSASSKSSNAQDADHVGCIYLDALEESIRLEVRGDQYLRKHNNSSNGDGNNASSQCQYAQALESYQHAQKVFPDPNHASLWGKQAFCHHQLYSKLKLAPNNNHRSDQRVAWQKQQRSAYEKYRQAYKIFQASSNMVLQVTPPENQVEINNGSSHHTTVLKLEDHPDTRTTMERLQQVVLRQGDGDGTTSSSQILTKALTRSVRYEHSGDEALWHYEWTAPLPQQREHYLVKAKQKYQKALQTMTAVTEPNGNDGVSPYLCIGFCSASIDGKQSNGPSNQDLDASQALCGQELYLAMRTVEGAIDVLQPSSVVLSSPPSSFSSNKTVKDRHSAASEPLTDSRYKQEITKLLEQSAALRATIAKQDATIKNLQQQQKDDERSRSASLERQQRLLQEQEQRHNEAMEQKCQSIQQSQHEIACLKAQTVDLKGQIDSLLESRAIQEENLRTIEAGKREVGDALAEAQQDILNLQNSKNSLTAELDILQRKCNKAELQLKKAESEISLLDSRLKTSAKRVKELEERVNDDVASGKEASERKIFQLENVLAATKEQLNEYKQKIAQMEQQQEIAKAQSCELKTIHEKSSARLEHSLAKLKELEASSHDRITKLESDCSSLLAEKEKLQQELRKESGARRQENSMRQKLQSEVLDAHRKYQEALMDSRKTRQELELSKEQLSLHSQHLNVSSSLNSDRPSMDLASMVEITFEKVIFLREKLNDAQEQIKNVRNYLSSAEIMLTETSTDVRLSSTIALANLQSSISIANDLAKDKNLLRKHASMMEEQPQQGSRQAIENAHREVQACKADAESLKADKAILEQKLEAMKVQKRSFQERMADMECRATGLQEDLVKARSDNVALRTAATDFEEKYSAAISDAKRTSDTLISLRQEKDDAQLEIERLKEEIADSLTRIEEYDKTTKDTQGLLQVAREAEAKIAEELNTSKGNLLEARSKIANLQSELEHVTSQLSFLENARSDSNYLLDLAKQEKAELGAKIDESQRHKDDAMQELTRLKQKLTETTETATRFEQERDSAKKELTEAKQCIVDLETNNDAKNVQIKAAEELRDKATEDLARANSQLAELKASHIAEIEEYHRRDAIAERAVTSITEEFGLYRDCVAEALDGLANEIANFVGHDTKESYWDDMPQTGGEQSCQGKPSDSLLAVPMTAKLIGRHKKRIERMKETLRAYRQDHIQQDKSVVTIHSQNRQAAEIIQTISAQLKSKNKKYKAVKKHLFKLSGLFDAVQTKLKSLREHCNLLSRHDTKEFLNTVAEIQLMVRDMTILSQGASGSSGQSISSMFSNGSTATFNTRDCIVGEQESDVLETSLHDALFAKAAESLQWTFESDLATYEVRKPVNIKRGQEGERRSLFSLLDTRTPLRVYSSNVAVSDPSSLEIAARIKTECGEGILILSGENNVKYRSKTSDTWNDFGNVNVLDCPLGWEKACSLDEVLEEAHLYRQKCCKALSSLANDSERDRALPPYCIYLAILMAIFFVLVIALGRSPELLMVRKL